MKIKRILFIEFLKVTAANHLLMLIKGLTKQRNCEIVLLCQKDSLLTKKLTNENISIYEIDYIELNIHESNTYLPFVRTLLLIFYIILKHKVNIIHCHRLNFAYLAIFPSIVLHTPLFVHVVIIEKLTSKFQNFLLTLKKNIKYIAVSKNSLEQFKHIYGIPSRNITYHYGGLFYPDMVKGQNKKIHWLEAIKNKKIIAMISRMDPLKGVDVFIEAAAILIKEFPDLCFIHMGNHSEYTFQKGYYDDCLKRVRNLKIKSNFIFVEYDEEILAYYKYFYLMALPTLKDTLSYVNLEANFNKVPVIFTDVDGLMETSKPQFNCDIPYPPSPILLANKLKELLLDEKKYQDLREQVFDYNYHCFNAEKNAARLVKLYETVL